jgi:hypothetical protein
LIEEAGRSHYRPTPNLVGRPSAAAANFMRLDSRHNQQWPEKQYPLPRLFRAGPAKDHYTEM